MAGIWKFKKLTKSDKMVDPFQTQFFTSEIVGGITSALVRETIQNSLDAKSELAPEIPVIVRFFLSGSNKALSSANAQKYFSGLHPHLQSPNNGLLRKRVAIADLKNPIPYLLIEDFGTEGLEGDPEEFDDPPVGSKNKHNFYWFWRNVGRSGKTHDERGRWGLGKAVYPKSSYIHTYLGFTIRESDMSSLLMGESILAIHKVEYESMNNSPYGYYGEFKDADEYFVTPIDSVNFNDNFISDFNSIRDKNNPDRCCGLSLAIPFPQEEITKSELLKAVVIQYFHPIISNQLQVLIEDADLQIEIIVQENNLEEIIKEIEFSDDDKISSNQLKKLFSFSRWALKNEVFLELRSPNINKAPAWFIPWYFDEKLDDTLKEYRDKFDNGQRVAFKVPVKYHRVGHKPIMKTFNVFLEKDEQLEDSDCHFIRDGITLIGIKPMKRKNIRALVIIDDSDLSNLLGDAENPAHTEWSKDSSNFEGKYEQGDKVISFIINSLNRLHGLLIKPSEGIDEDVLGDLFYVQEENADYGPKKRPNNEEEDDTGNPSIKVDSQSSQIVISRSASGFNLKANKKVDSIPNFIKVKCAYIPARGNPLRRYNPYDFDMAGADIKKEGTDVRVLHAASNSLILELLSPDFEFEVSGFDSDRDLYIKAEIND